MIRRFLQKVPILLGPVNSAHHVLLLAANKQSRQTLRCASQPSTPIPWLSLLDFFLLMHHIQVGLEPAPHNLLRQRLCTILHLVSISADRLVPEEETGSGAAQSACQRQFMISGHILSRWRRDASSASLRLLFVAHNFGTQNLAVNADDPVLGLRGFKFELLKL